MTTQTKLNIGLFGYGVVGKGFYKLTQLHPELGIHTQEIVAKNPENHKYHALKQLSYNAKDILGNNNLKTVVEVIDNSIDAFDIATQVLTRGNTLVSANKKMIAENFDALYALLKLKGGRLFYEASTAASIPIIKLLDEYFANERIQLVEGILNGTSNYILSGIFNHNLTYNQALNQAKELGFAESNPILDVEGLDALNKLIIINAHAFGVIVKPNEVFSYGITLINEEDILFAKANNFVIKQVAHASTKVHDKLLLYVAPQFVSNSSQLFGVNNENNGIVVNAEYSGQQFYYGKGAGSKPTGAAVLADVLSSKQKKSYNYTKLKQRNFIRYELEQEIAIYIRYPKALDISRLAIKGKEHFISENDYTVIGNVSLTNLLKHKDWLKEQKVSIICYNQF